MATLSRCKGITQRKTHCKRKRLLGLIYCSAHFHEENNYEDYIVPVSRSRREGSDCLSLFPEEIWASIISYMVIESLASFHKTCYYLYDEVITLFNQRMEEESDKQIIFNLEMNIRIPKIFFPYVINPYYKDWKMMDFLYRNTSGSSVIKEIVRRSGYVCFLLFIRNVLNEDNST